MRAVALGVLMALVTSSAAFADDPVVNYVRVSVDSDTQMNCNDLNIEIGNVNRDIGLLENQDEQLQGIASQGVQTFVPQSTNAGNALELFSNTMGDAAVIDAENSLPAVEASLSTARARVGYLESLQGSCANNTGQQQQPVQQQGPQQQQAPQAAPGYNGPNNGFFIVNQLSGKCIDVPGAPGTDDGLKLELWDCEFGVPNTDQRWEITKEGFIRNTVSGRCIDVPGNPGVQNGLQLNLWDCETYMAATTDQRWTITKQGFIKNRVSGKCIDVQGTPGVTDGAPVQLSDCEISGRDAFAHALTDQKWTIHK